MGDYDNDGAVDVIVGVNGGPPVLLKNNAAKGNNWLGLKLEGVTCNRDAIGARMVWKAGGKKYERLKNNGGSYLSRTIPVKCWGLEQQPRSMSWRFTGRVRASRSRN